MANVLITGANRGLGLEFVKQYTKLGWNVFACCRKPDTANELQAVQKEIGNKIKIFKLDVTKKDQICEVSNRLKNNTIDVLINNAGIFGTMDITFDKLEAKKWLEAFETNTISPLLVTKAFIEQITNSELKIIATISSIFGSINNNIQGGEYIYRSSKAALNMALKSLAVDLKNKNVTVLALHPGWVRTDMGGKNALVDVEKSVQGLIKVINKATLVDSGKFIDYRGKLLPW